MRAGNMMNDRIFMDCIRRIVAGGRIAIIIIIKFSVMSKVSILGLDETPESFMTSPAVQWVCDDDDDADNHHGNGDGDDDAELFERCCWFVFV